MRDDGDFSFEKFSVDVEKVRAYAEHLGRLADELPESRALEGQPNFGSALIPGAHRLAQSYAGAMGFLRPLADQIRGGVASGQAAAGKAVENYLKADESSSGRAQAVLQSLDGFVGATPPSAGQPGTSGGPDTPGQPGRPGTSGDAGPSGSPDTGSPPPSGIPEDGEDVFGPYLQP